MQDFDDDLHVDLTPLIDVIFMLVIFFIMTMSFTLPVVEFNLPQSSTAQNTSTTPLVRICIDKAGSMSVEQSAVSYAELEAYIKEQVQKQGSNLSLEVLIDADTPTQYLIKVADLARIYTQGRLALISSKQESSEQGGFLETQDSDSSKTNSATTNSNSTNSMSTTSSNTSSTATKQQPSLQDNVIGQGSSSK